MKDYISADEYLATLPTERQKDIIEGGNPLIAQYTLKKIRRASHLTQKAVAARLMWSPILGQRIGDHLYGT